MLLLFQPVREIADKWNIFLSGMASADRIFAILGWATETSEQTLDAPASPIQLQGHIVFDHVWFAYETHNGEERWVLRDFSLEIRPGMRIGIVGHTGSGKTTLVSLLLRLYEPQKGRILIDGKDIRDYDRRSLRQALGIIQQDVFLFSGSIRDNVTLWKENRQVPEAAWNELGPLLRAGVELDERGSNLSMGQRQVLAFSRAWAAQPSVWILDEASANIDSETERKLEQHLAHVSAGKTCLFIAHRLATVRDADLIIVLHQGTMIERGNHASLIRENGLYARLYRYQCAMEPDTRAAAAHLS